MKIFSLKKTPFLAMFFLTGCFFQNKTNPIDTYDLLTLEKSHIPHKSKYQIIVTEPKALKVFDNENIVIKSDYSSVKYLSSAQWIDRLPKIVQARLAESLQKSSGFRDVATQGEGVVPDYEIISEIRHFEIFIEKQKYAYIELFLKINNYKTGVVLNSRSFEAKAPVIGYKNHFYIKAINEAFEKIMTDVVLWVSSSLNKKEK